MKRWILFALVLPPALLGLLLCGVIVWVVLANTPPMVSAASLGILAVLAAWVIFGRRKSGPLTESALLGRHKSTGGLL